MTANLVLGFDIPFGALYSRDGLAALDRRFIEFLQRRNPELHDRLTSARAALDGAVTPADSDLIVDLAPALDDFLADLFGVAAEVEARRARDRALAPLYAVKRLFVQRRAAKKIDAKQAEAFDDAALRSELERHLGGELTELRFARQVESWMDAEADHAEALDLAARYAAWAVHSEEGKRVHAHGVLFKIPRKVEPDHLAPVETVDVDGVRSLRFPESRLRGREGFALTDAGADITGALDQANYCIWCHNQGKDSCSKGMREKTGAFKRNSFGVVLAGCPLEVRIPNSTSSRSRAMGSAPWPSWQSTIRCVRRPVTVSATTA